MLETGAAYLVLGWLIIQVADVVFDRLNFPDWVATFVTVLVIAGFPIAIALSWFLEIRGGNAVLDDLSPRDSRRRRFSRTYVSVVASLAIAGMLVFAYDKFIGLPYSATATSTELPTPELPIAHNSIAVLPFLNNDGSDETRIFANGLVDDVITRLSRVPGLLVSSRGDSSTLDPNSPSDKVRDRLRVAMYLEGSVEMSGDRIRVITQLIDSATGFHKLSRTFDRPKKDFFDIRDEVTQLTVSSLRVSLPDTIQELTPPPDYEPELDTYVLYRHGIEELDKPRTVATTGKALEWFDKALDVDPEYAAAHAGRCGALVWQYSAALDSRYISEAESACAHALELNPNLDVVHAALGDLYRHTGRYADSASANEEALRINPNNVTALLGLSEAQRLLNQPEAAERTLRRAIGLQPGNWAAYNALGIFLFHQGRYAEATEQFLTVVTLDDTNVRGYSNLATAYMLAGDFDTALPAYSRAVELRPERETYISLGLLHYYLGNFEAAAAALQTAIDMQPNDHIAWMNYGDILFVSGSGGEARDAFARAQQLLRASLDVDPNKPTSLMDLAWIQAMLGDHENALRTIERAQKSAPADPYAWYVAALIHNDFGDTDAALVNLRTAADKGFSRTMISAEPHFDNLARDARFQEILTGT
ncbi:MAG: tetratricopeptide repeat protein [Woeseiaceae bacterium]